MGVVGVEMGEAVGFRVRVGGRDDKFLSVSCAVREKEIKDNAWLLACTVGWTVTLSTEMIPQPPPHCWRGDAASKPMLRLPYPGPHMSHPQKKRLLCV